MDTSTVLTEYHVCRLMYYIGSILVCVEIYISSVHLAHRHRMNVDKS